MSALIEVECEMVNVLWVLLGCVEDIQYGSVIMSLHLDQSYNINSYDVKIIAMSYLNSKYIHVYPFLIFTNFELSFRLLQLSLWVFETEYSRGVIQKIPDRESKCVKRDKTSV